MRAVRRRRGRRPSLVTKLAKVYLDNDTAIAPVLRALFTSAEFAASVGPKVRTPFEDLAATVRTLGLRPGDRPASRRLDALYNDAGQRRATRRCRWSPPNGYPDVAAAWASPSAFLMRCNSHLNLAAGWYPNQLTRPADLLKSLVPALPATYGALVDALAARLVGTHAAGRAHRRRAQRRRQAADQSSDQQRQVARRAALPYLIALVLDSPSFQLR